VIAYSDLDQFDGIPGFAATIGEKIAEVAKSEQTYCYLPRLARNLEEPYVDGLDNGGDGTAWRDFLVADDPEKH
jgi:hypothetical protein